MLMVHKHCASQKCSVSVADNWESSKSQISIDHDDLKYLCDHQSANANVCQIIKSEKSWLTHGTHDTIEKVVIGFGSQTSEWKGTELTRIFLTNCLDSIKWFLIGSFILSMIIASFWGIIHIHVLFMRWLHQMSIPCDLHSNVCSWTRYLALILSQIRDVK